MQIALFIDIDNAKVSLPVFKDILEQVRKVGKLSYCKVYGFNERKHMKFDELIEKYGFDSVPTMRYKKRAKSQLDTRIIIDAVNMFHAKPFINGYCFVTGEGDLVPLLSFLRAGGKTLMTVDTDGTDGNDHMYDQKLRLDIHYSRPSKITKRELSEKLRNISARSSAINSDDEDEAEAQRQDLVNEIEELLSTKGDNLDEEEEDLYSSLEDLLMILK